MNKNKHRAGSKEHRANNILLILALDHISSLAGLLTFTFTLTLIP